MMLFVLEPFISFSMSHDSCDNLVTCVMLFNLCDVISLFCLSLTIKKSKIKPITENKKNKAKINSLFTILTRRIV